MDSLTHRLLALALLLSLPGCVPTFEDTESVLDGPRLLAVQATPAEGPAADQVHYRALYADSSGILQMGAIGWSYCLARKPAAELGPVAQVCLSTTASGSNFAPISGTGLTADGTIPTNTCSLFGPIAPLSLPGEPPNRPVDPDETGGYSQPIRAIVTPPGQEPVAVLAQQRIACGLSGASQAQTTEFNKRYRMNANPEVASLELIQGDMVTPFSGLTPLYAHAGDTITLRVHWPTCPESDVCGDGICGIDETPTDCPADCTVMHGCAGAERYLRYDLASRTLVTDREAMRVAWFTSGGMYSDGRTGVTSDDTTTHSDTELTVPDTAGEVALIVVLRDSRTGVGWVEARLNVLAP